MFMSTLRFVTVCTLAFAVLVAPVAAHPMTIKGTVAAIEKTRIQVKTGDEKKGDKPEWSAIDAKTKIVRDNKAVSFEDAHIKVGERVVLLVDHNDKGVMTTTEIRLAAQ
jgi:hypothetical protein